MTPEQWERVQDIFEAALERLPDERLAYLDEVCAGSPDLHREVASLLQAASETGPVDALERDLIAPLTGGLQADPMEGRRVGPYRILRQLGEGGMGAVFLAERADGAFEQQVALKLVRQGLASETLRQRFLTERRILARLQHPNIARLLDGGVTPEGQPYFAMEFVDGQPVGAYADARQLSITERLRLFKAICQAVQYAHQNLVVHRDLKPSNILVTEQGQVKLLDFGIAKLIEEENADALTQTGLRVMTPEYAAPEQVRGEPVTTATDVYSLGVVLYELLTGHRPYQVRALSPSEVERVICEAEPPRPSTAVRQTGAVRLPSGDTRTLTPEDVSRVRGTQPERLQRRLVGDLDMIVMKALAKEPPRRYVSAEALLEDINRHLAGLPVEAQGDTVGYRLRKFVQRHRWGVAVAAAFVLLMTGTAVAMTLQQAATARERDRARLEAARAGQVSTFLASLFQSSDPETAQGDTLNAYEILARGADRIGGELADQPEVQASLMDVLSQVYVNLGAYDRAEHFASQSLTLRRQALSDTPAEVAQSLHYLADAKQYQGDMATAESLYTQALDLRRQVLGPEHPDIATNLDDLADVLLGQGSYDEAEKLYREALDQRRRLFGNDHADVATSLNSVATILYHQGRAQEAEPLFREALALRRRLLAPTHPDVASSLNNLAIIVDELGRIEEAEPLYREALQMRLQVLGPEHPRVAVNMSNLGSVLARMERYDEAEHLYRDALALTRRTLGEEHRRVALQLNNLGRLLHDKGSLAEAEQALRESLALRRRTLGPEHPDVALTLTNLAPVLKDQGKLAEAVALYREALRQYEHFLPADHPSLAHTKSHLANTLTRQQQYAEAEALLADAYNSLLAKVGAEDARTRTAVQHLAELYEAWSQPAKAAHYRALLADAEAS